MLRIGTRGSDLARWQANWIAGRLRENGEAVEILEIKTAGDLGQKEPIRELGGEGVFTKEIQAALLRDEIDLAVHSLKDLPTEYVPGLLLAAVPQRGPFRDALLCPTCSTLESLPAGSRIGTGSMRRKTQILNRFAARFRIEEIRGNVPTRIRRLHDGEFDAIILAEAGLVRLGLERHITAVLGPPDFLPAVGQGALGIEIRSGDAATSDSVRSLNDPATWAAVTAERALLRFLRGGCLAPIAAFGSVAEGVLTLEARVLACDGKRMIESRQTASPEAAAALGESVAESLFRQGATALIEESRQRIDETN